ncbi:MAG: hypothetical protein MPEBLZ_02143 [Candidatus Methanoperedens nitroreducens]|uniref:Uncharacterized protein n=1 Tax=Candidatus Methanoperedens nitratireducens TaxID=1392998 RepID=A0A0P8DZJ0_9EURY|nr:hypothetical protein [Candidatus Methanoperedens sp. BLZ2]KAB2944681.1 MAG: hypothetical protein F9K14_13615 [Candidatus Methanoperedens sp.]KPQ43300.1 MAG: hypothetical protein MPEBLZ_02143 [Candidatus Methanoperedens sp. BLZ1]MBZ0175892.1 hypothetical protein [Candidatus Methanoperedens nitroreducens]CAG0981925.1 hypothetical protein METP2_02030 [Methanosarcinales archaeon]MCX9076404.1 hypothetical protein [Candidatus Methanoperedens sp.]
MEREELIIKHELNLNKVCDATEYIFEENIIKFQQVDTFEQDIMGQNKCLRDYGCSLQIERS